jgi:hypothetical protein
MRRLVRSPAVCGSPKSEALETAEISRACVQGLKGGRDTGVDFKHIEFNGNIKATFSQNMIVVLW